MCVLTLRRERDADRLTADPIFRFATLTAWFVFSLRMTNWVRPLLRRAIRTCSTLRVLLTRTSRYRKPATLPFALTVMIRTVPTVAPFFATAVFVGVAAPRLAVAPVADGVCVIC